MKEYVLITGGSSGLGLELVKECHARGLTVCNLSKNPDKISKLYEMFPERFVAFAGDLTDHEYVSQSVAKLFEDGRVTLTDYASAGKLWNDESKMAVWMLTK